MPKIIINMEYSPRHGDLKKAAAALGLRSTTSLRQYIGGKTDAIGKAKRARIVIRYSDRRDKVSA